MHNILEKDENNKALQTTLLEEEGQSALFVVDLNLKIVYVGKRVLELLNSPLERFLGKQFSDALPLFTADGIEVMMKCIRLKKFLNRHLGK